ncbi:PXA domain-containing protein [Diplogelasinospora grovesii]|uniref:PXA domain-containing protein n=1 Tax=Diplogelasinospora grovesii TaxID=303347 RepID=A0AAN6NAK4_9PEZI|nr:PXA domain-containing protein [Diplogelasinospora grovesii]
MSQQDVQSPGAIPDNMEEEKGKIASQTESLSTQCRIETNEATRGTPVSPGSNDDEDITTKIFQFLAIATPQTLGGVGVGLAAVTYFILGQIGLLLIGAFGGIVLFVQWEQRNAEVARAVRGEKGVDILARLLETKKGSDIALAVAQDKEEDDRRMVARGFDDFQPETREALNELVDAIIRDYVKWWYSPIVPSDKFFPLACRKTLTSFILAISNRLSKKRPADAFLDFLTNSSSLVIVFFSELSNAFAEYPSDSKVSAADAVYNYLATNPDSNLANLLSQRQQAGKFRMVAEDLLGFLDRSTYECDPARVFLREILAGVILEMSLQTCSKPEWINSWIVYLLEAGEPDFSQAIDVGMQTGPGTADVAFADLDGNVGNIGLTKGNRNSFEQEKARRKESMAHKKNKLSKADEETDAMEEIKRLNQMIADEEAQRAKQSEAKTEPGVNDTIKAPSRHPGIAAERLANAFKQNADKLDLQSDSIEKSITTQSQQRFSDEHSVKDSSDGSSTRNEAVHTPITPVSALTSSSETSSPPRNSGSRFTSFDQIVPPVHDGADADEDAPRRPAPLTLHNATITVLDEPGDARIRTKPTWDYLVQIEPATTAYPGWMIVRKYSDFERLHEVLKRIATISGATAFNEQHNILPSWKLHTRTSLRGELERYVRDACWYQSLAESEGMKRFLERDQGQMPSGSKSGFQAFEKLGKNVFDVLTSAPVEGSKAVVGGVTGVLGNIGGLVGQKRPPPLSTAPSAPAAVTTPSALQDVTAASRLSLSTPPRVDSSLSLNGAARSKERASMDSQRSSVVSTQPGKMPMMERQPSYNSQQGEASEQQQPEGAVRVSRSDRWDRPTSLSNSARNSRDNSRASSLAPIRSPSALSLEGLRLPPPPDMMTDDYESSPISPLTSARPQDSNAYQGSHSRSLTMPALSGHRSPPKSAPPAKQHTKLSEQETRVAVELLFAVINELYTLSSAWNIRRTLLAAAKSFLLRPGNPSLTSIQTLIQDSVLEANTSDSGLAAHLKKLRENTMPTEEERAKWPAELTTEEKEKLRIKARKLLIESGVPAALMGVMGQSATADAMGRLFDCLQIEEVAKGLMFGIMLQAMRTITH